MIISKARSTNPLTSRYRNLESTMKIAKIALLLAGALLINLSAWSTEDQVHGKPYQCGEEKMTLKELENGRLELEGKTLTGHVYVHAATGMFRGEVKGWGTQHKTPQAALDATCRRILERSKVPSEEELQKALHEFYESLK